MRGILHIARQRQLKYYKKVIFSAKGESDGGATKDHAIHAVYTDTEVDMYEPYCQGQAILLRYKDDDKRLRCFGRSDPLHMKIDGMIKHLEQAHLVTMAPVTDCTCTHQGCFQG